MDGNLRFFKLVYKIFNGPAGAPRSPKAFKYGALPHTLLKVLPHRQKSYCPSGEDP